MTEKKYKNSILIEGDYNFNYLTNLLFLSKTCITDIFVKKGIDPKSNKKMFKNIKHLCEFLESSIEVFNRLSLQEKEVKCIIHNIEYDSCNAKIQADLLVEKISDEIIKKNKEVDDKYNEED